MEDQEKTREQLINELIEMRQRITELETSETKHKHTEKALQESVKKYRNLAESLNELVYRADPETFVATYVNKAIENFYGYTVKEWLKDPSLWESLIHPDDKERTLTEFAEAQKKMESAVISYRIIRKDKTLRWVEDHVSWEKDQQGKPLSMNGVMYDITQHERASEALLWEVKVNAAIAELSHILLSPSSIEDISFLVLEHAKLLTDSKFGYTGYIDPQTGYLVCPTLTRDIWDACQVNDKDIVFEKFGGLWGWVLNNKKPLLTNTPMNDPRSTGIPDGHIPINRFLSVPALIGETLVGQVSLANSVRDYKDQDIALVERLAALYAIAVQRKRADDIIRQLAYHDSLTGLPNRLLFNDRLILEMAHAERNQKKLALILLDLDNFKDINDRLGHNVGDQLLKMVGDRLSGLLRKADTIARMGGDEFMLLLPEIIRTEYSVEIAHKIKQTLQEPFVIDGQKIRTTASIGIAIYPDDGGDIDTLIRNADIAMYHVKEQGRNKYLRYAHGI